MNCEDIFKKSIILIGPMGAGKSTIATILSKETGMPRISLDNRKFYPQKFYETSDYDYQKKFELDLVKKIVAGLIEPSVIDFGAGHSVYENAEMFEELKRVLACFSSVVLLLPSDNMAESIKVLNERIQIPIMSELDKENWRFLTFEGNEELPNIVVYTNNKSPEIVAEEIIELINLRTREIKI